ncbi:MAG: hypothetical protein COX31_02590 [Candidatus Moranbacteria bacterium CG23_combo_of_CG06-09_8_20_14_all_40_16]|nr:MAG: hypothetical protein COX31_02590 [Candidatus Moranbacteria bacterium CG23_combo_of_CG06-09_8_20_14_all_40_16]
MFDEQSFRCIPARRTMMLSAGGEGIREGVNAYSLPDKIFFQEEPDFLLAILLQPEKWLLRGLP